MLVSASPVRFWGLFVQLLSTASASLVLLADLLEKGMCHGLKGKKIPKKADVCTAYSEYSLNIYEQIFLQIYT
jgi:hypothetical protein